MGSRYRATLPSEAEVTADLIQAVPELAGFDGALTGGVRFEAAEWVPLVPDARTICSWRR